MIDNFPVICEYLEYASMGAVPYDEGWVSRHCCISQCFLQIIKCTDDKCCSLFQTKWLRIFPNQFLPALVQIRQDPGGPTVPLPNQIKSSDHFPDLWKRIAINNLLPKSQYEFFPYDMYCPSIKSNIKDRV